MIAVRMGAGIAVLKGIDTLLDRATNTRLIATANAMNARQVILAVGIGLKPLATQRQIVPDLLRYCGRFLKLKPEAGRDRAAPSQNPTCSRFQRAQQARGWTGWRATKHQYIACPPP